jgi:sec-independent protein translocase protein TatA
MFGNLGFGELMVILVIVLVLFGAKRVPEISASFGKGIREFKRNLNDIEQSVTTAVTSPPVQEPVRQAWTPLPPTEAPVGERAAHEEREPKRLL